MTKTKLKTYSLNKLKDEFIGKHGTKARDQYENELTKKSPKIGGRILRPPNK